MRVLVLSDSHGKTKNIHRVIKSEKKVDMIIHLGDEYSDFEEIQNCYDIPCHGVIGNVDGSSEGLLSKVIDIEGKKVFLSHGHNYNVKFEVETLKDEAKKENVDVVLFGHSHIPYIEEGEIFLMNPGSITKPKYNNFPSYAILEMTSDIIKAEIFYLS